MSRVMSSEFVVFSLFRGAMYFKIGFREVELALNRLKRLGKFLKMKITRYQKSEELLSIPDFS